MQNLSGIKTGLSSFTAFATNKDVSHGHSYRTKLIDKQRSYRIVIFFNIYSINFSSTVINKLINKKVPIFCKLTKTLVWSTSSQDILCNVKHLHPNSCADAFLSSGIKRVVKLFYNGKNGSFTGLAYLRSRYAVCNLL